MKAGLLRILASAVVIITMFFNNFTSENGPIVLVGGGPIPFEAIQWLEKRALDGHELIISCDSTTRSAAPWESLLSRPLVIAPEELTEDKLPTTSAIIIEGGDQWDYLQLRPINGKVIEKAHQMGIPILGTSAGAMILGQHFFTAEKGTINSEQAQRGERICLGHSFVRIKPLDGLMVETHYRERGRKGRLEVFLKESGAKGGIGIDESTALCIDKDGSYHICGKGGVEFLNHTRGR